MTTKYVVAVYEIDRAYGGPEEGGWWYTTGQFVRIVKVLPTEDAAFAFAARFNHLLSHHCRPRYSSGSVMYRGGEYSASVYENLPPQHYPETRPHYE